MNDAFAVVDFLHENNTEKILLLNSQCFKNYSKLVVFFSIKNLEEGNGSDSQNDALLIIFYLNTFSYILCVQMF